MGNGRQIRHAREGARRTLSAVVAAVGLSLSAATTAHAATACGAIITNLAAAAWFDTWGVTVTGAQIPMIVTGGTVWETSATAYTNVIGGSFTAEKAWWNVTANITLGPDGALWFSELQGNKVGRLQP